MGIVYNNNKKFVGCDMHKKYSVFVTGDKNANFSPPVRIPHHRHLIREFLTQK